MPKLAGIICEARGEPTLAGEGSGREWRTRGGEAASQSEFERTTPPHPAAQGRPQPQRAGHDARPARHG